jgi:hypothetical protein
LASSSRETLRQALFATLPDYDALRRRVAKLVRASLPRSLRRRGPRRRYPMAVDLHHVAYFKRQTQPPGHVRKGGKHTGTSYSHAYATASLLRKGQYYVVAVTPYDPWRGPSSVGAAALAPGGRQRLFAALSAVGPQLLVHGRGSLWKRRIAHWSMPVFWRQSF